MNGIRIRIVAIKGLLLLIALFAFSGCLPSAPEPTPTPTKTPVEGQSSQGAAGEPVVEASDTTPTPEIASPTPQVETPTPIPPTPEPAPTPTEAAATMAYTGETPSNPEALDRRPIFVCVNNDAIGRSAHFGLAQADLVYEYIVDGFTVTRLSALYQSQEADRIGPVRSARMPNIWMTYMYDATLACSGGSDQIRYLVKNEVGFPYLDADIDDPSNTVYFFSVGSDYRTRLQTSTEGVRRWLQGWIDRCIQNPAQAYCQKVITPLTSESGGVRDWSRPGFTFSQEPASFSAGEAQQIQIPYPGGNSVEWRYDPSQNHYLRFQGGRAHIDNATGAQISAENVVVLYAEHELTNIVEDSLGTKGVDVKLYGFGDFRIFRDGLVYEGTWRANDQSPPRWLGPGEQIVPLKPGQSWVQVVRTSDTVSY